MGAYDSKSRGHKYTTCLVHLVPVDIVDQPDCNARNAKKPKFGRGDCYFVHRAANVLPCYLSVTSGERLDLHSCDSVSDVRLRTNTCVIPCGSPRRLDLNCNHLLQQLTPRPIETSGAHRLSKIEEPPNQCLPNEEYYGEPFATLLNNPNRRRAQLVARPENIMRRRTQVCVTQAPVLAASNEGASSSLAAPPAPQLLEQCTWSWS